MQDLNVTLVQAVRWLREQAKRRGVPITGSLTVTLKGRRIRPFICCDRE